MPSTSSETTVTTIDAHQHVWDLSVRDQDCITGPELAPLRRDFTLDDLRPQAAAAGVDATVLVQTICVPEEVPNTWRWQRPTHWWPALSAERT